MRYITRLAKAVSAFWRTLSRPEAKPELQQLPIQTVGDLNVASGPERSPQARSLLRFSDVKPVIHDKLIYNLFNRDNDYTTYETRFRYDPVRFVDFCAHHREDLQPDVAAPYAAKKRQMVYNFLNRRWVPKASIIIPAGLGRASELAACIESVKWQNFLQAHPDRVELLVVQDGDSPDPALNPLSAEVVSLLGSFPHATERFAFRLRAPNVQLIPGVEGTTQGRSTARNVGIVKARNEIAFFIDSSMVLNADFLTEHMIRHDRSRANIALLGFKETIDYEEYQRDRELIRSGKRPPRYREDWKWKHVLKADEAPLQFGGRQYKPRDEIHYMEITDNLKQLRWGVDIGRRSAATFFHTGITSVPLAAVKDVGGFDPEFNPLWGFEDSFLGALLLATGGKFVPCPSSVAFQLKHPDPPYKTEEIAAQRQLFFERLDEEMHRFNNETLTSNVETLFRLGQVEEVKLP